MKNHEDPPKSASDDRAERSAVRSNSFQRLIFAIERQLAPLGATVRESAKLDDLRTGHPREVDILIELRQGVHLVRIAVECRDHERKQDTLWIEQLDSKFRNLNVDKVVAVSSSGFSETAIETAAKCKITTLTLEDAEKLNWPAFMAGIRDVLVVHFGYEVEGITTRPVPGDDGRCTVDFESCRVHGPSGNALGSLLEVAIRLMDPEVRKILNEGFRLKEKAGLIVDESVLLFLEVALDYPLTMRDSSGSETRFGGMCIEVRVIRKKSVHPLEHFTYGDAHVANAEVESKGKTFLLTFVETPGMPRIRVGLTPGYERKP